MAARLKRSAPTRKYKKTIYIFCNGHTERLYFSDFRDDLNLSSIQILPRTSEYNRLSLVRQVKHHGIKPAPDTEVWIVFDVDDDPSGQTHEAVALCNRLGYRAIVSNECFEVWIRLHYDYFDSAIHRRALFDWMSQYFGCRYEKNKRIPVYSRLKERMPVAVRNAKRLAAAYGEDTPYMRRNPYTNMYEAVEALCALKSGLR